MPTADWTLEKKPGESWTFDEPDLTFDELLFDGGLAVTFDSLGAATEWELEDL